MRTKKLYYTSTMFSGETILSDDSYETKEEAKRNTNTEFTDVDWIEYEVFDDGSLGMIVDKSYSACCPWI